MVVGVKSVYVLTCHRIGTMCICERQQKVSLAQHCFCVFYLNLSMKRYLCNVFLSFVTKKKLRSVLNNGLTFVGIKANFSTMYNENRVVVLRLRSQITDSDLSD